VIEVVMEVETSFGRWLQRRRKALDLTQEALAQRVACAAETLRKIEADVRRPSRQIAERLAEALEIPESDRAAFVKAARAELGVDRLAHPTQDLPQIALIPARASSSQGVTFLLTQITPTSQTQPPPSSNPPKSNLPSALTTFIGRERERGDITRQIAKHRLITLTGSGGVGKTRLALHVGEQVLADFPDGVWLVELAPLLDPVLVPHTTAMVIGLREEPQGSVIDMLSDYLREKQILLILDNCEHLLDACAQFADQLLKLCPRLKILATSREPLGILGEAMYPVPSLELPEMQMLLEKIRDCESVRLFEERAQLAQINFSLTIDNVSAVAKICTHLDGIPLAIELAAARIRTFSAEQIAARLDESFSLLTTGNRAALPRHQTLKSAIDWSYDLLSATEQTIFQRLCVFVNGWTLESAKSICSDAKIIPDLVLGLLTQLINKSIVITQEEQGKSRYRMLETVRQYAQEKLLASGEAETYYDAHLNFFLKLAEEAEPHLKGAEQVQWINRLEEELDNMRLALDRAISIDTNQEAALKLGSALWRFWQRSMRASEGRTYLARLLNQASKGDPSESTAYARALTAACALAYFQSDYESAQAFRQRALDLFRKLDDTNGVADSLHGLGNIALSQGHYESARSMYEECLAIRQKLGQRESLSGTLGNLGLIAYNVGDYITAHSLEMESYDIFQEFGNKAGICFTLNMLGYIARRQGDLQAARRYHEESIACYHQAADQWGLANALNGLAEVALAEGDLSAASSLCRESLNLYRESGAKEGIVYCFETMATIAIIRKLSNKSAALFSAAAALRNTIGLPLAPIDLIQYEQNMLTLHEQLDDMAFKRAWKEGLMMSLDQMIEYALSEPL
jgi:predicted ATPase/transcriptional regulator with XRE-family HTH domain